MADHVQKFLQVEESADQLVAALKKLHDEAVSYKDATSALGAVRDRLLPLIESTQRLAGASHEVVQSLKAIGAPEILRSINAIADKVDAVEKASFDRFDKLKLLIIVALAFGIISSLLALLLLLRSGGG